MRVKIGEHAEGKEMGLFFLSRKFRKFPIQ
jgi:hypothetical protein